MSNAEPSGSVPETRTSPEQTDVAKVVVDVRMLLSSERLADPVDRGLCTQAITFLESPAAASDLPTMVNHARNISEVMLCMEEVPPEITALYLHLTKMHCRFHLEAAKAELRQQAPDTPVTGTSLAAALNIAKILAKGEDTVLLQEVEAVQRTMNDPVQEGRPVVRQQVGELEILDTDQTA